MEFRARCDLVFDRYDADRDGALRFAELAALMEAGGRRVETQEAYASMCSKLGCDASAGLGRKDLHLFFEKAPPALWEEVYRSIDPLAGMVRKGAAQLPEAFLERPLSTFLFEDEAQFANVYVELNAHMYYGAAELVSLDTVQAYFGPQRLELHICAPGSFGAKDMYKWKFVVAPLAGEVVPEDCIVELKQTDGRFGSQRLDIKLMKAKKRKWYKVGQVSTGPKT
uniref:EF-hand domain-containing protein n=1 Tax=Zooxanthella nutricula TaxID=1333877 RepID=A0A7S2QNM7_9DINO